MFDLQDKMGKRIAEALRVELQLFEHRKLADAEAIEHYLRARKAKIKWHLRGPTGAVAHYRAVLERAPDFRPAIAGLAVACMRAWAIPEGGADEDIDWAADAKQAVERAMSEAPEFAESRIDTILNAQIREVLGSVTSSEILSADRANLALRIRDAARGEATALGVEIIDVRLMRTDLPEQNLDATFARMRAEREREAADEVARGNEAAQRVRALADRTKVELVSDAQRQADIIRGEADAKRNAIFAAAYGADPEFFDFYRSLAAYRAALQGGNSTMVMAPDSEFFDYLKSAEKP